VPNHLPQHLTHLHPDRVVPFVERFRPARQLLAERAEVQGMLEGCVPAQPDQTLVMVNSRLVVSVGPPYEGSPAALAFWQGCESELRCQALECG
jgi:hypothetical protein